MIALAWLRGLARAPPRASARHRRGRRARGRAARVDRHVPVGHDAPDDRPRGRAGARRLAGGGPAGARRRRPDGDGAPRARRDAARCRWRSPPRTGFSATRGRLDADHRAGPRARPAGRLRPGVPGGDPAARRPHDAACCSRSRPRPTCMPRPATRSRSGTGPPRVRVDGIVDLPAADSLFQRVGAPPGAQPQAPPDNVVLLPAARVRPRRARRRGDARRSTRASSRRAPGQPGRGVHAGLGPRAQPRDAARRRRARRRQPRLDAGPGALRTPLYAQLLFLFLGLPGAILAGLITASLASARAPIAAAATPPCCAPAAPRLRGSCGSRSPRRRSAAAVGIAAGLGAALPRSARRSFGTTFGARPSRGRWGAARALAGLAIAAAAIVLPSWRDARAPTVRASGWRSGATAGARGGRAPGWT